jgi:hypothetical protein
MVGMCCCKWGRQRLLLRGSDYPDVAKRKKLVSKLISLPTNLFRGGGAAVGCEMSLW